MLILALAACSNDGATVPDVTDIPDAVTVPSDPTEPTEAEVTAERFYDPDRVVEITIEMADADAEAMALQTNDLFQLLEGEDCMASPWKGPFTWFPADVTIDGERFEGAGVRKKGLIGSMSSEKPSLKIDLDQFVDQSMGGLEHLVLNNSISDPGLVRQCLGYDLFAAAGHPAPRCNFAHVTVNGIDLGVYVNVEPPKKDFLRHAFDGDDDGDLYEGTLSDFRDGWTGTFEPDTDDTDPALGPVLEVTEILASAGDDTVLDELGAVLDLEAFARFWALETLIGHLDGYNGNTNNFYVYRPERTGKIVFVPWGIDATFYDFEAFGSTSTNLVLATSELSHRLWSLPEGRELYLDALDAVLAGAWDEDHLLAEIDRMAALVEPYALPDDTRASYQDQVRDYVVARRGQIEEHLRGPLPELPDLLRGSPCLVYAGELRVDFDATWGTLEVYDPFAEGSSSIAGTLAATPFDLQGSAIAGESYGMAIVAGVAWSDATTVAEALLYTPMATFTPGTRPIVDWQDVALLIEIDALTGEDTTVGSLWNATLTLDEVETTPGGRVRGSFEGDLYSGGFF